MSEALTGKEKSSCGLRQKQVRRSNFPGGRLATHLVSLAISPGVFVFGPQQLEDALYPECLTRLARQL